MVVKKTSDHIANMTHLEQLDLLRSVLDSSTEYSIVATDLEGNILAWNAGATKTYGYEARDVLGKNARLVFVPEDIENGKFDLLLKEVQKQNFWTGEMQRVRKNGTRFTVLTTVTLRRNASHEPVGFTAIARDLTELQNTFGLLNKITASQSSLLIENRELEALAEQLRQTTRLKNEFIANVSHELRSPLNGIIGYTQILVDGLVDPQSTVYNEFLNNILSSSYQLLHLINDVLDLAKIESGKMTFHNIPVNLTKLISEIKNIFHMRLTKKNIYLKVEIDTALQQIIIDPDKLKQVFYNYIANAIKFTDEDGQITIRISPHKNKMFKLEVQDTGIGIAKTDLPKLFVTFQQLDTGYKKKYQGTGLGLALTKRIVETQGGQVGAESILGKGSIFYAILPLEPQTEISGMEQEPHSSTKSSILVVENGQTHNEHIVEALDEAGYYVATAKSPETLLNTPEKQFDVVILDLLHLDQEQWEIVRHLRAKQAPTKILPTVVLTVTTEKPVMLGFKIKEFITKPIEPEKLLSAVANAGIPPQQNKCILIVDSDEDTLAETSKILRQHGYKISNQIEADCAMSSLKKEKTDAVILDPFMSNMQGFAFLHAYRLSEQSIKTPLIICTQKTLDEKDRVYFQTAIQRNVLQEKDTRKSILAALKQELPPSGN